MTTSEPLPLPGLEDIGAPSVSSRGEVEAGVRRTIAQLARDGHVDEADAGRLSLAIAMARVIQAKQLNGRMSTIGNDARVLMDLLDGLVDEADAGVDANLRKAMEAWSSATAGAPLPDPTDSS